MVAVVVGWEETWLLTDKIILFYMMRFDQFHQAKRQTRQRKPEEQPSIGFAMKDRIENCERGHYIVLSTNPSNVHQVL